jgi:hypothetical protein
VGLPTTKGIGANKTCPIVLRWLGHAGRVNLGGGRHVKCTRETG